MILGRYSARSIKFGRYAYVNEPHIAVWNLTRFTETLLPLLNEDGDEAVSEAGGNSSRVMRLLSTVA